MIGRDLRDIQEGLRMYSNRQNGFGEKFSAIFSASENGLQGAKGILYNADGTIWNPQSPNASLPQLRGYDFPADIED